MLKTPAKINIGLKIINKREDGYHNLETIFYPVSLFDELEFKISTSKRNTNSVIIKSNSKIIPVDRTNICFRLVEAFFRTFRITDYYSIDLYIKKNIPVGGGLGGGSSDAACILKYLIRYFNIDIVQRKSEILSVALAVGSDVPFFLVSKPCFAQSRGEIISKLDEFSLKDFSVLLVNSNLHVSTKWAFETLGMKEGEVMPSELKTVRKFEPSVFGILENDFEKIVFKKYPELERIKNELREFGAVYSSMSGSGATMFGIFEKNNQDSLIKAFEYYKEKKYFAGIS
ncbi:MAG: 4-(cytidine 5'-diphospho)-2-C-methyl-D-erythritol kinase [Ignavibacteriae bacterium]|nr:4-(cytidine 5'-diphospho)-2-C-methyl-D-erythritol kinase [Ignavibacteriota bacterium]